MSRQPVSRIRRQTQTNVKQRYQDAFKKYVSSEFTYNSHCLLRKLCENGEKEPNLYNVPLYKIMIQITKIMMMNELQLLFFGATVQEMGWKKVEEPCLNDYIGDVTDITPRIENKGDFVKKLQLSLLLIAYIVKIYLNEDSTLYDFKIRDLVRNNFEKMYQEWVQKVQNHFKFSPKHMNKLFKELDKGKNTIKEEITDYNQLVAKLFQNNRDDEADYYSSERQVYNTNRMNERQRDDEYYHNVHGSTNNNTNSQHHGYTPTNGSHNNRKIQGLPVHQQEELVPPTLPGRSFSSRSNVSGLGKRESIHELFNEGELKPYRGLSQIDDDFMGNGLE